MGTQEGVGGCVGAVRVVTCSTAASSRKTIARKAKKCQKGSLRDDAKREVCAASSSNGRLDFVSTL